jgi:DNA-binding MarR family transcriptional regulator
MKRPDATLELFILEMLRQGASSQYDLLKRAGLSIGASSLVIRRLEKQGQIRREKTSSVRKRIEFIVTSTGIRRLQREVPMMLDGLDDLPREVEAAVRLACLAVYGGRRKTASELLRRFAAQHKSTHSGPIPGHRSGPELNLWILSTCEQQRRVAEVKVLMKIARALAPNARRTRR